MKNIKNILLLIISLLLFSMNSVNANDKKEQSISYTKEELLLIEQLSQLDSEFDISDGELISIVKTKKEEDFLSTVEKQKSMKPSVMTMYVFVQRINTENTIYDDFKIQVIAVWNQTPFFRMQDVITLNWSDDFTMYSSSTRAYYKSVGLRTDKTSMINSFPERSVTYSVGASDWYVQALDKVILTANVRKFKSEGTTKVIGAYVHATAFNGNDFNVTFEKNGDISFSNRGLHNARKEETSFNY